MSRLVLSAHILQAWKLLVRDTHQLSDSYDFCHRTQAVYDRVQLTIINRRASLSTVSILLDQTQTGSILSSSPSSLFTSLHYLVQTYTSHWRYSFSSKKLIHSWTVQMDLWHSYSRSNCCILTRFCYCCLGLCFVSAEVWALIRKPSQHLRQAWCWFQLLSSSTDTSSSCSLVCISSLQLQPTSPDIAPGPPPCWLP